MTQANNPNLDGEALSHAAAAVRVARVDGITPPQEGTEYDLRLARAAVEAYLSVETSRRDAESHDLRRFAIEVHSGRDIRASLSEAYARLPICPLLALVQGAWQEIDALTGLILDASVPLPITGTEEGPRVHRLIGNPGGRLFCEGDTVYVLERSDEGVVVSQSRSNPTAERLTVPETMLKPLEPVPSIEGPAVEDADAYLESSDSDGKDTALLLAHYHGRKMTALRAKLSPYATGDLMSGTHPD